MLMDLPTGLFLLRMVHECMHIALHRPIAAGRIRREPTARFYRHVGGPLLTFRTLCRTSEAILEEPLGEGGLGALYRLFHAL